MIGIIDYGMGNLGSVSNACRFLGLESQVVTAPDAFERCDGVILPGVGAFGDCMQHLEAHGFVDAVKTWIGAGKPFLGICLGLQALFEESEESPGIPGFGLLGGRVRRFNPAAEVKVPQIGWNSVVQQQPACPLFRDVPDETYFYFVHSYYVDPTEREAVAGATDYAGAYTSVVWKDNVLAVQFHPEKSQRHGLTMLRNFGALLPQESVQR